MPVHIVQVDDKTGGLELAMAENLARQDLDPVEEARGFQRLREAGLTKKSIGERLGLSQKRITERLELLKLPGALHPADRLRADPARGGQGAGQAPRYPPGPARGRRGTSRGAPAQSWMEPLT